MAGKTDPVTHDYHASLHSPRELIERFYTSILLLILLFGGGTVAWNQIEGDPLLDSFYTTVQIVSTLGFGDRTPHTIPGEILVIVLVFSGYLIIAWVSIKLLAFVIEGELTRQFRQRKFVKRIAKMQDHIIVSGVGRVGAEVVGSLRDAGTPFVCIDVDEDLLNRLLNPKEIRIIGDSTEDEVLKAAGIERAKGLVVCLPDDAQNVFTILSAKGLNPSLFVIARASLNSSEEKLRRAGADRVVMPSRIGGRRMAHMVLRPGLIDFIEETFSIAGDRKPLLLEEVILNAKSCISGKKLRDSDIKTQTGAMIVGIRNNQGRMTLNPPSDYELKDGESLLGLGHMEDLQRLRTYVNETSGDE